MDALENVWKPARALYVTALSVFVFTVVIGILNGTDLVIFGRGEGAFNVEGDLGRQLLLTHVHAGALGFITLAVVAAALRMFTEGRQVPSSARSGARGMAVAMAVSVGIATVTFATTQGILRPIAGTLVFVAMVWLFSWIIGRMRGEQLTVPQLAVIGSFVSLLLGAAFGVLLGIFVAEGSIPGVSQVMGPRIGESHPGTMVIGFLILAGLGLIEWLISDHPRDVRSDRWGVVQVSLVFLAGIMVLVGILADNFAIAGLNVPLEVVGIIIFLVRMRSELRPVRWAESLSGLYGRLAIIWLIGAIAALAFLLSGLVSGKWVGFTDIPLGLLLGMDHMNTIGVITLVTFGLVAAETGAPSRLDRLILAGINLGLLGFVFGLFADSAVTKRIGTSILGISLLAAIWFYVGKLKATVSEPTTAS